MSKDKQKILDSMKIDPESVYLTLIEQEKEIQEIREQLTKAKEALQNLYDEQNGPPLIRSQQAWEAAMAAARTVLNITDHSEPASLKGE